MFSGETSWSGKILGQHMSIGLRCEDFSIYAQHHLMRIRVRPPRGISLPYSRAGGSPMIQLQCERSGVTSSATTIRRALPMRSA